MSARAVPLGRILRAEEAGLFASAGALVEEARREAAALLAAARAQAEAERARMVAEEEKTGRARLAAMEIDAAAAIAARLHRWEAGLGLAIAEGVARILGEMPAPEAVAKATKLAIAELAQLEGVTVHVHPEVADAARAALSGWGSAVRVVPDPLLPPDGCTIETPSGILRAGLADQLAALRAALAAVS